VCQTRI
jgi:hypothetical protein